MRRSHHRDDTSNAPTRGELRRSAEATERGMMQIGPYCTLFVTVIQGSSAKIMRLARFEMRLETTALAALEPAVEREG